MPKTMIMNLIKADIQEEIKDFNELRYENIAKGIEIGYDKFLKIAIKFSNYDDADFLMKAIKDEITDCNTRKENFKGENKGIKIALEKIYYILANEGYPTI